MPNTKATARPAAEVRATMLTPMAEPAFFPEPPVVVLVLELSFVDVDPLACWLTTETETLGLVTHCEPSSALALDRKVISAHYHSCHPLSACIPLNDQPLLTTLTLYNALPLWPEVTTWMVAWVPSATERSTGSGRSEIQSVPLPVSFQREGVRV